MNQNQSIIFGLPTKGNSAALNLSAGFFFSATLAKDFLSKKCNLLIREDSEIRIKCKSQKAINVTKLDGLNPVHPDQVVNLLITGTLSILNCYGNLAHEYCRNSNIKHKTPQLKFLPRFFHNSFLFKRIDFISLLKTKSMEVCRKNFKHKVCRKFMILFSDFKAAHQKFICYSYGMCVFISFSTV